MAGGRKGGHFGKYVENPVQRFFPCQTYLCAEKDSCQKLISLGASTDALRPLGFAYSYRRENHYQNEGLICTNSARIEGCEELICALSDLHFHIAAITEKSSGLMRMEQYPNVSLYLKVQGEKAANLFQSCDYYLDINHGGEILSTMKQAFLHNHLILDFAQTLHNRALVAQPHIFDHYEELAGFLRRVMNQEALLDEHLFLQRQAVMAEDVSVYRKILKDKNPEERRQE